MAPLRFLLSLFLVSKAMKAADAVFEAKRLEKIESICKASLKPVGHSKYGR